MASGLLLSRLHRDLAELFSTPYPGVAVFADDADMRKLCLVLTPPSGPWKDLALHFNVELPANWPASPPRIQCTVSGIDHPNLFGSYICCDLLKDHTELQRGYTGGYTPALTLRGLFLQFLTFFSSTAVEQDYGGAVEVGDHVIVKIVREESIWQLFAPLHESYSYPDPRALAYETAWKADLSPEIVLGQYETLSGLAVHSVKSGVPHKDRLHKLEFQNPRWKQTLDRISKYKCTSCPYGSDELPHRLVHPSNLMDVDVALPYLVAPLACHFATLSYDALYTLASHLPSESLLALSEAYPPFREVVEDVHELLKRELTCFFLRTSIQDSILGIGIHLDNGSRTLSSDFDWLSEEAFQRHSVRRSIQKREFEYFLPLALSVNHFERAEKSIWSRLQDLDRGIRTAWLELEKRTRRPSNRRLEPPKFKYQLVDCVFQLMNGIVVSLMKSCDDVLNVSSSPYNRGSQAVLLHASEKAINSYCHLFHLLISLCRTTPSVLQEAERRVRTFMADPKKRLKDNCPDIGEFIVMLTLVLVLQSSGNSTSPLTWAHINGPLLEEVTIRNVRWVLKDFPELEVTESGSNPYRLTQTFMASKTSLRLLMFQATFLDMFVSNYASDLTRLDKNYGFADKDIPPSMVEQVKAIYKVNSWRAYFERVNFAKGVALGPEKFCDMLRACIKTSGQRRYHVPVDARKLHLMSHEREKKEKAWSGSAQRK